MFQRNLAQMYFRAWRQVQELHRDKAARIFLNAKKRPPNRRGRNWVGTPVL